MKTFLKRILCVFFVLTVTASLSACGGKKAVRPYAFNSNLKRNNIASVTAADNENFELLWNSDDCEVLLKDVKTGKTYSNIPASLDEKEDFDSSSDSALKLLSPITVDCVRTETHEIKTGYAADCINNGDFSVSLIDNGIRVTYIFDELKVSVPIKYTLFNDGLKITLDSSKIAENGKDFFIHSVAISPFMCHTENMKENSYLFYPSGSGVLVNMDTEKDVSINYTSEIYGLDRMSDISTWCKETKEEEIRMPVFGVKRGDDGIFAIITEGSESGSVLIDAYNKNIGYSSVYPEFAVRGETSVSNKFLQSSVNSIKYSDYFSIGEFSVCYYPLSDENASYNGMAEIYRKYLKNSGMKTAENGNALTLKVLGGAMVDSSVVGIPTRKFFATTTLEETEKMVSSLNEKTNSKLNVDLVGFGATGMEISQIGGGFTVASKLGGKSGLKKSYSNMIKENNSVFFDIDPISIAKNGKGYSKVSDVAVTTTRQRFGENYYRLATNNKKKLLNYFISRELIPDVIEKTVKTLNKFNVKGVAFDSFSNVAYSDYSSQKYYSKRDMGKDVSAAIKKCSKNGLSVLSNAANCYAAICSDLVVDVPTQSSKLDFFGEEIPFYQMALHGYVPMYSTSLNLSNNSNEVLLKAAESGIGISYTVIKNFDAKLRDEFDFYHNTCFDDLKDSICENYNSINELYQKTSGYEIANHSIVEKSIHKTVFENGVTVYTNFGENEYQSEIGKVAPYSFIFSKN